MPPRERLWRSDYEITLEHGVRQPYAENGGPGGFAHALRNIGPVLEIAHTMEQACPDAWFINYTNPMMRICDAIARYSDIKVVGLCHQIYEGYGMIGYVLADVLGIDVPEGRISTDADPRSLPAHASASSSRPMQRIEIKAAGLNHFTWMSGCSRQTDRRGSLPAAARNAGRDAPADFEPLTRRVYEDLWPHAHPRRPAPVRISALAQRPATKPWEKYDINLYDWDALEQRREDRRGEIAQHGCRRMSRSTTCAAVEAKGRWR